MDSAALSGRTTAAVSRSRARGVACLPPPLRTNPYQTLLHDALRDHGYALVPGAGLKLRSLVRNLGRVGVLHLHWPESYWRHETRALSWVKVALLATRLSAARLLGYRIVWTAHQVLPHETAGPRLDRMGTRVVAGAAHAIVVHDEATAASLERILGPRIARKGAVVPHGTFAAAYPPGRPRAEVRSELGLGERTFLFLAFGHVRAYKDLALLLEAFQSAALEDAALVVAGRPHDASVVDDVTAAAARDPRIVPLLRFVEDEQVAELFGAADAAVIARRDGGTSGVLVLAQSFGTPVVAADTPTYSGAAAWVFASGEPGSLARALEAAASGSPRRVTAGTPVGWAEVGRRTAALYGGADG